MAKKIKRHGCKVVTSEVIIVDNSLRNALNYHGSSKYATTVVFPESNKELASEIQAAMRAAFDENGFKLYNGTDSKIEFENVITPLKRGSEVKRSDSRFKGMYFLKATTKEQPAIVDENLKLWADTTPIAESPLARVSMVFDCFHVEREQKQEDLFYARLLNVQILDNKNHLKTRAECRASDRAKEAVQDFCDEGSNDCVDDFSE